MPSVVEHQQVLLDAGAPLDARIRAMYALKTESGKTLNNATVFMQAVTRTDSILLQHELLYNLGQFQIAGDAASEDGRIVPFLLDVARGSDASGNLFGIVSRHEALEALGAIFAAPAVGTEDQRAQVLAFVEKMATEDALQELRESAALAAGRIQLGQPQPAPSLQHPYVSVDPTPAFPEESDDVVLASYKRPEAAAALAARIAALSTVLGNPTATLWDRYRAMFSLRNIQTEAAVLALCQALDDDSTSALFRHEIAFVLGQLEHPSSAPALERAIRREAEHPMVRHEAAEAVGALAEPAGMALLKEYATHPEAVLRDSCVVAIQMHEYWSNFKAPASSPEAVAAAS